MGGTAMKSLRKSKYLKPKCYQVGRRRGWECHKQAAEPQRVHEKLYRF